MPKQDRKRIDDVLLRDRLGLDEDWLNRDEDGVPHLPSALPRFITHQGRERVTELEVSLERLVAAGCRRKVLNFCLQQLSPGAERLRHGQEWESVLGQENSDPESLQLKALKLATREDLESVVNNADKTLKEIRKYRREILLTADLTKHPLPTVLVAEPPDAGEVISLLLKSLAWVRVLAKSYTAPFETTLLKSKGLLYLTLYVSICADPERLKKSQHRAETTHPASRSRRERRGKRDFLPDHALAHVASFCTGDHWAPSDLYAKLKGFRKDHSSLYAQMTAKMTALHRNATR